MDPPEKIAESVRGALLELSELTSLEHASTVALAMIAGATRGFAQVSSAVQRRQQVMLAVSAALGGEAVLDEDALELLSTSATPNEVETAIRRRALAEIAGLDTDRLLEMAYGVACGVERPIQVTH